MAAIELKRELKALVAKDKCAKALKQLNTILAENSKAHNLVIQVQGQISHLKDELIMGTISNEEASLKRNKISAATIGIIKSIGDDEAIVYDLKTTIYEKILVISKNEEEDERMKGIFANFKYRYLDYAIDNKKLFKDALVEYDLLVFNNYPKELGGDIPSLLENYMSLCDTEEVNIPILYFGAYNRKLQAGKYADRVYFSNSKFSIHSRIAELLTYLNYTNSHSAS